MRKFLQENIISAIKRQTYTGGKSAYSSVGSGTGYLRPLSETQSATNNLQYGVGFSLLVENSVDIREADKVTVDSVEYVVNGVATHARGAVPYKRCLLTKPEKQ